MKINKQNILDSLCYTMLVYDRINKKLNTKFSKKQIEVYILDVLKATAVNHFTKTGKNFYVVNSEHNIRITINSNTFRIITVDRIQQKKGNL